MGTQLEGQVAFITGGASGLGAAAAARLAADGAIVVVNDLDAAAADYAAQLPAAFDLVHLGLGPDGHTASLVPGDAVLDMTDRLVAPTAGLYQGRRRMTLTYSGLARASAFLWLVTGTEKAEPLRRLLAGDPGIPAGRVTGGPSTVMCDTAAHAG